MISGDKPVYTFERISRERIKDLYIIHRAAFNENPIRNYYESKLDTKFAGVENLGFLAYDELGNPAAFYGVYPCIVKQGTKLHLAVQSGDTMTHPNHMGKGLFTTLARMTYELAKSLQIQFVFGFPNSNSKHGFFKKLNWQPLPDMVQYSWKIKTLPLAAMAKKIPLFINTYQSIIASYFNLYRPQELLIPHSCAIDDLICYRRDEPFLRYKSFYNNHLVEISGIVMWIKVDGALLVGDVWFKNQEVDFRELKKAVNKMAVISGCTKVLFQVSSGTKLDLLFRKNGLIPETGSCAGYLPLNTKEDLNNLRFVLADYDTF